MGPTRFPLHRRFLRVLSWHRRKLAAGFAVIAVLAGIGAAAPADPPTVPTVVAARSVAAGVVLGPDDIEVVRRPPDLLPDGAIGDPGELLGRLTAGPVPRGAVLTGAALAVARQVGTGHVLAPLRLADADLAALLRPGDVIDVVAADEQTGQARTVAAGVRLVTVPAVGADTGLLGSGGTATAGSAGALCLVEVARGQAEILAAAAVSRRLTVVWPDG